MKEVLLFEWPKNECLNDVLPFLSVAQRALNADLTAAIRDNVEGDNKYFELKFEHLLVVNRYKRSSLSSRDELHITQ